MREMETADWASQGDQELLERRISTLGLRLEGTALEPLIRQLYDEVSARGLVFHPPCHVGDEWFVPIGIPAIFSFESDDTHTYKRELLHAASIS